MEETQNGPKKPTDPREFLFSLHHHVKPEVVEGHSSLFHFDIADSGQFTVMLESGDLTVSEGFSGEPTCKVTTTADTFTKLLTKQMNPMMAMMTGKLKISNPGEMLKYAKIFGLM